MSGKRLILSPSFNVTIAFLYLDLYPENRPTVRFFVGLISVLIFVTLTLNIYSHRRLRLYACGYGGDRRINVDDFDIDIKDDAHVIGEQRLMAILVVVAPLVQSFEGWDGGIILEALAGCLPCGLAHAARYAHHSERNELLHPSLLTCRVSRYAFWTYWEFLNSYAIQH